MEYEFIAGYGPIVPDPAVSHRFWAETMGLDLEEIAPGYYHSRPIEGAKVLGFWPLSGAAESVFGVPEWPAQVPVPQAWIEFEVASPAAVAEAVEELRGRGAAILREAAVEPWGQTTARLLSPEGLLVGISYLPSFHDA